jgi:membrane protein
MKSVSDSGMPKGSQGSVNKDGRDFTAASSGELSGWSSLRRDGSELLKYLLDSEVHTFAFSVAANAILSFIPFIVLLYTLAQSVFHSAAMVSTITEMVKYFLPSNQKFIASNLFSLALGDSRHGVQIFSLIMILVSCTGIFMPLEVALNRAWGVTKGRNYISNQVVSFGLAILMLILGFAAIFITTVFSSVLGDMGRGIGLLDDLSYATLHFWIMAVSTGIASILFFFAIYCILPNCRVPWRPVFRASVLTGLAWLLAKYVFVEWLLPRLDLKTLYGAFYVSVGLIFWSYASGLILFAGAQFSAAKVNRTATQGHRD